MGVHSDFCCLAALCIGGMLPYLLFNSSNLNYLDCLTFFFTFMLRLLLICLSYIVCLFYSIVIILYIDVILYMNDILKLHF